MGNEEDIRKFVVPEDGVDRLDTWLVQMCESFSRNRVKGLIDAGFVRLDGEPVDKAGLRPPAGSIVELTVPPPVPAVPEPEDIPLSVIYEDEDILVIDKPAGMVVHPAPGHFTGTLVNALLHHCPNLSGIGGVARPGIVHRLDQDTSGVMAIAKSELAMAALVKAFSSRTGVAKTYLALTHGMPTPVEGRIENLIGRSPYDRKKMAIVEKNGKIAITRYHVRQDMTKSGMAGKPSLAPVECHIETGRTHQIRVHLASIGCPVAGDAVYGRPAWDKQLDPQPTRQLLHAWRLELVHPATRKQMVFTAPIPADFAPFIVSIDL